MNTLDFKQLTEWQKENFRLVKKGGALKIYKFSIDHNTGRFLYKEDYTEKFAVAGKPLRRQCPFKEIVFHPTMPVNVIDALLKDAKSTLGEDIRIARKYQRLHVVLAKKICKKFDISLRIVKNMSKLSGYAAINAILMADYTTRDPYYFFEVFLHELVHARLIDYRFQFLWKDLPEYNKYVALDWYTKNAKVEWGRDLTHEIPPVQITLAHRIYDQLVSSEYAILDFLEDLLHCSGHNALDSMLVTLIQRCAERIIPMPHKQFTGSRILDR